MSRGLATDYGNRIEIYDTLDHNIQGFGQQQSGDASLTFSSQHGVVRVNSLPRVDGEKRAEPVAGVAPPGTRMHPQPSSGTDASSIVLLLEQLGQLKEMGILTAEEFTTKKAEILKRL